MSTKLTQTSIGAALALALVLACAAAGCREAPTEDYAERVAAELATGERHDTLLGGLHFGMTRAEFFAHCRAGNARGEMRNGVGTMVRIDVPSGYFPAEAGVEFYPTFDEADRLVTLPGRLFVVAWSPWAPQYRSDSLLDASRHYLADAFGGGGVFEDVPGAPVAAAVKVDGNRRVVVWPRDLQYVGFEVVDLTRAPADVVAGADLERLGRPATRSFANAAAR